MQGSAIPSIPCSHVFLITLFIVGAVVSSIHAQSTAPACATSCLRSEAYAIGCPGLSDLQCVCVVPEIFDAALECVQAECPSQYTAAYRSFQTYCSGGSESASASATSVSSPVSLTPLPPSTPTTPSTSASPSPVNSSPPLTPSSPSTPSPTPTATGSGSSHVALIAGVAGGVGGAVVVAIVVIILWATDNLGPLGRHKSPPDQQGYPNATNGQTGPPNYPYDMNGQPGRSPGVFG